MIKKIIFDIDGTLIGTDSLKWEIISKAFTKYGIKCSDEFKSEFDKACIKYQNNNIRLNKDEMLMFFSKELNINFPEDFIDSWREAVTNCVFDDNTELVDTIKYLSDKYEIVAATNWFTDQQIKRLENSNVLHFFGEVVGCDNYNMKPDLEMYNYLMKDNMPEEVVVVGDNFVNDIEPAIKLEMFAYYITDKEIINSKYRSIKKLSELKELL